jgi:hypothetical protein
MAPEFRVHAGDAAPRSVRLRPGIEEIDAQAEAERFVVPPGRGSGPVGIHDFELGTDTLRFAFGRARDAELSWADADGDGVADDLVVSIGRRGVELLDLADDLGGRLPQIDDLF